MLAYFASQSAAVLAMVAASNAATLPPSLLAVVSVTAAAGAGWLAGVVSAGAGVVSLSAFVVLLSALFPFAPFVAFALVVLVLFALVLFALVLVFDIM